MFCALAPKLKELGSMYDYLAKIILLGPSGSGKYGSFTLYPVSAFRKEDRGMWESYRML